MLKVRWVLVHEFLANFISSSAVKKFENRLTFDEVRPTESLKVGTFFETQCNSKVHH